MIITTRLENGMQYTFREETDLSKAVEHLADSGHLVVWGLPVFYMESLFPSDIYPILEDRPMRARWFDIFSILRSQTGLEPSLSKTAKSSLGFGPQSDIARLPRSVGGSDEFDIENTLHDKLNVLQQLYEYAVTHGKLSFFFKAEDIEVEVDAVEPSLL